MKLSILICTIPSRYAMFSRLKTELVGQILPYEGIQILSDNRTGLTIGQKRNHLLSIALGEYVCFIDDDDWVGDNYISFLMQAIELGSDCASLKGEYFIDGYFDGYFDHSIKYNEWKTNDVGKRPLPTVEISESQNIQMYQSWKSAVDLKYERYPNHLNLIRATIAKQFKFPEKNFGEDHDWSKQVHESGLLKTEYYIDEIIYFYRYISNK